MRNAVQRLLLAVADKLIVKKKKGKIKTRGKKSATAYACRNILIPERDKCVSIYV